MTKVGNSVTEWIKQNGLTQQEFADRLGKSQNYVSMYLCGKAKFGKKVAREWSNAYGFSYTFLLTGEGQLIDNVDENKVIEAAAADVENVDDASYWRAKYEELADENKHLNGVIDGLRMAMGLHKADDTKKGNVG